MNQYEKLMAQADILEEVARWAEQPDEPTGARGLLCSYDVFLRAVALRAEAEIFYYREKGSFE